MDIAAVEKIDLIVISSHGYSGITRWVLGSVAERVLHSAPCPVLVIRRDRAIRQVLIPLDGSELSERALRPGLDVAAGLRAEVTLLRAVEPVDAIDSEYLQRLEQAERGLGRRFQEEYYRRTEIYLRDLAAAYKLPGLDIHTAVRDGPAAPSILEFAEGEEMDLIVMATHGRTGLQRWVYGSVTGKVMHAGCCSMLIVRTHDLNRR